MCPCLPGLKKWVFTRLSLLCNRGASSLIWTWIQISFCANRWGSFLDLSSQTGLLKYTCILANTLCKPVSKNTYTLWALARAVQANKFAHNQRWGGIFSEFMWVHHSCLLQPDSRLNLTWIRCQAWDMPTFSEVVWAVVNFPASLKACSDM